MDNIQITIEQARNYIILINIILGLLFGIFPLLTGIKMNNRKYGIFGFIGSVIGGAILGVFLSFPIAAVFTWLTLKNSVTSNTDDVVAVNETAVEVKADTRENR
jgi:hypothetical protein